MKVKYWSIAITDNLAVAYHKFIVAPPLVAP
jgi:hypothetical protein